MKTCKCGCGKTVKGNKTYAQGHRLLIPIETLFWDQVEITETCWLWQGPLSPPGYGMLQIGQRKNGTLRRLLTHRWAYESLIGPIPEGLHIDHLCRVRQCVNPEHLEPVTSGENVLRGVGITAQLAKVTHCPQGHPYAEENLYLTPSGARICRVCRTQHYRAWYYRHGQEWFRQRYLAKKRAALHSSRCT